MDIDLVDVHTKNLLDLARQELNFVPRDENYSNPFIEETEPILNRVEKDQKKLKKKLRKKGPRMSHSEL